MGFRSRGIVWDDMADAALCKLLAEVGPPFTANLPAWTTAIAADPHLRGRTIASIRSRIWIVTRQGSKGSDGVSLAGSPPARQSAPVGPSPTGSDEEVEEAVPSHRGVRHPFLRPIVGASTENASSPIEQLSLTAGFGPRLACTVLSSFRNPATLLSRVKSSQPKRPSLDLPTAAAVADVLAALSSPVPVSPGMQANLWTSVASKLPAAISLAAAVAPEAVTTAVTVATRPFGIFVCPHASHRSSPQHLPVNDIAAATAPGTAAFDSMAAIWNPPSLSSRLEDCSDQSASSALLRPVAYPRRLPAAQPLGTAPDGSDSSRRSELPPPVGTAALSSRTSAVEDGLPTPAAKPHRYPVPGPCIAVYHWDRRYGLWYGTASSAIYSSLRVLGSSRTDAGPVPVVLPVSVATAPQSNFFTFSRKPDDGSGLSSWWAGAGPALPVPECAIAAMYSTGQLDLPTPDCGSRGCAGDVHCACSAKTKGITVKAISAHSPTCPAVAPSAPDVGSTDNSAVSSAASPDPLDTGTAVCSCACGRRCNGYRLLRLPLDWEVLQPAPPEEAPPASMFASRVVSCSSSSARMWSRAETVALFGLCEELAAPSTMNLGAWVVRLACHPLLQERTLHACRSRVYSMCSINAPTKVILTLEDLPSAIHDQLSDSTADPRDVSKTRRRGGGRSSTTIARRGGPRVDRAESTAAEASWIPQNGRSEQASNALPISRLQKLEPAPRAMPPCFIAVAETLLLGVHYAEVLERALENDASDIGPSLPDDAPGDVVRAPNPQIGPMSPDNIQSSRLYLLRLDIPDTFVRILRRHVISGRGYRKMGPIMYWRHSAEGAPASVAAMKTANSSKDTKENAGDTSQEGQLHFLSGFGFTFAGFDDCCVCVQRFVPTLFHSKNAVVNVFSVRRPVPGVWPPLLVTSDESTAEIAEGASNAGDEVGSVEAQDEREQACTEEDVDPLWDADGFFQFAVLHAVLRPATSVGGHFEQQLPFSELATVPPPPVTAAANESLSTGSRGLPVHDLAQQAPEQGLTASKRKLQDPNQPPARQARRGLAPRMGDRRSNHFADGSDEDGAPGPAVDGDGSPALGSVALTDGNFVSFGFLNAVVSHVSALRPGPSTDLIAATASQLPDVAAVPPCETFAFAAVNTVTLAGMRSVATMRSEGVSPLACVLAKGTVDCLAIGALEAGPGPVIYALHTGSSKISVLTLAEARPNNSMSSPTDESEPVLAPSFMQLSVCDMLNPTAGSSVHIVGTGLCHHPELSRLALYDRSNRCHVYNDATGPVTFVGQHAGSDTVTCATWIPDFSNLLALGGGNTISLFDCRRRTRLPVLELSIPLPEVVAHLDPTQTTVPAVHSLSASAAIPSVLFAGCVDGSVYALDCRRPAPKLSKSVYQSSRALWSRSGPFGPCSVTAIDFTLTCVSSCGAVGIFNSLQPPASPPQFVYYPFEGSVCSSSVAASKCRPGVPLIVTASQYGRVEAACPAPSVILPPQSPWELMV